MLNLHPSTAGTLAQLVEQRTENPCVPGSIPGGTTKIPIIYNGDIFIFGDVYNLCFIFFKSSQSTSLLVFVINAEKIIPRLQGAYVNGCNKSYTPLKNNSKKVDCI